MLHEFRENLFAAGFLVYPLDKRGRESVFLAEKNSDFFHSIEPRIRRIETDDTEACSYLSFRAKSRNPTRQPIRYAAGLPDSLG